MAEFTLRFYAVSPNFLGTTVGASVTYTGPATADGTAIVTDNEPGIEGTTLDDDSAGGETARADVTIGGQSSSGSTVDAELVWTVLDPETGETFQIAAFEVEQGPAAGTYTLSEQALVPGRTYEILAFNSNPDAASGDIAFGLDEQDLGDGIVEGTAGDDTIDAGYTGDPEGDRVDAGVERTSETFRWSQAGNDEQNIAGGVSQVAGAVRVDVSFQTSATTTDVSVESSTAQYTAPGESFSPDSALSLGGTHAGADVTVATIDFSAVEGSGFADAVENVSFRLNDVDQGGWQDVITVRAFDAQGNELPVDFDLTGNTTDSASGNTVTAGGGGDSASDAEGSVRVDIAGPVSRVEITYDNGGTAGQVLFVTDIQFDAVNAAVLDDMIDAGAGNDIVEGGLGDDTILGGSGDDTLSGGAGDDLLAGDGATPGTWSYQVFTKDFTSANGQAFTIEDGTLAAEGTAIGFDAGTLGQAATGSFDPNDFGVIYTSTLTATDAGTYRFETTSDDGSTVRILDENGQPLEFTNQDGSTGSFMNNDFHQAPTARWGEVTLEAGKSYTIEVRMWENAGGQVLSGRVTEPDGTVSDLASSPLISGVEPEPGDDVLTGGAGADTLIGGGGDDTLNVGSGDVASGGAGDDLFRIDASALDGSPITVTGGEEDETAGDTLDFAGTLEKGSLTLTNGDDTAGGLSGTARLTDGSTVTFSGIETIICFTAGTRILTDRGLRPIESLRPGDGIVTRDHGVQPLRWIGSRRVAAEGRFAPVRFAAGSFGNACDLFVSPQHRMLITGWPAQLHFGEDEVLAPALHLVDDAAVSRVTGGFATYLHLLFDRHEIVYAEGVPSESFHPGSLGLDGLLAPARDELFALFPDLRADPAAYGPAARRSLRRHEAALIRGAPADAGRPGDRPRWYPSRRSPADLPTRRAPGGCHSQRPPHAARSRPRAFA